MFSRSAVAASSGSLPAPPPREPVSVGGLVGRVPPQSLFILGAVSQYLGSALAVLLFPHVPAAGVAWLRVLTAAAVLVAWRRPWRSDWTPGRFGLVAAFGVVLGVMNVCFYLAIARIPLGTGVAIEFLGPITVAALGSRTRRDGGALALAVAGVVLLADVRLSAAPLGVALALAAGACWALYIVLGHRVAREPGIRPQDGLAGAMGIGALVLAPALAPVAGPAFATPVWLAACVGIGLASSVVPYGLEQVAMRRLPRARFALLLSLLPATAAIIGGIVLGQVPRPVEALGIALVVVASGVRSHAEV